MRATTPTDALSGRDPGTRRCGGWDLIIVIVVLAPCAEVALLVDEHRGFRGSSVLGELGRFFNAKKITIPYDAANLIDPNDPNEATPI
jgi:hypothetical protein